jgi:cbb3-type cytochrome oxidase subunit 1
MVLFVTLSPVAVCIFSIVLKIPVNKKVTQFMLVFKDALVQWWYGHNA